MSTLDPTTRDRKQTIARARAVRAENAIAAALYANRAEEARAAARVGAMTWWAAEYRRAAARCRRLGEIIRSERQAA